MGRKKLLEERAYASLQGLSLLGGFDSFFGEWLLVYVYIVDLLLSAIVGATFQ